MIKVKNFCCEKFWSKMKILIKIVNFGQKCKFWSKMQILVKNANFAQKYKFWSKVEISKNIISKLLRRKFHHVDFFE